MKWPWNLFKFFLLNDTSVFIYSIKKIVKKNFKNIKKIKNMLQHGPAADEAAAGPPSPTGVIPCADP